MRYEMSDTRKDKNSFIACLVLAPAFPFDADNISPVITKFQPKRPFFAVLGAIETTEGWAFTAFSTSEKEGIGDALVKSKVATGDWKWFTIYNDDPE